MKAVVKTKNGFEGELLVGLVFKADPFYAEELIKRFESDRHIKLVYVRRSSPSRYLLIVETERIRREGNMNAAKHR